MTRIYAGWNFRKAQAKIVHVKGDGRVRIVPFLLAGVEKTEEGCAQSISGENSWPQYWPQTQKYSAILVSFRRTEDRTVATLLGTK